MKKLVETVEVAGEGLVSLLGERIFLRCMNYFYVGRLVGVNEVDIILADASIVYDTGAASAQAWATAEKCSAPVTYVRTAALESYEITKK